MTDRKTIEELVQQELKEANEKYPLFYSTHEAYAVIKEEIDELMTDISVVLSDSEELWKAVKENDNTGFAADISDMRWFAVHAAAEAIQVAAMCQKAIDSEV